MVSGSAQTESGKKQLQGSSVPLDSVDRHGVFLRRCYWGQGGSGIAGGEELRRQPGLPVGGAPVKFRRVQGRGRESSKRRDGVAAQH
jgi:hypothetical protein